MSIDANMMDEVLDELGILFTWDHIMEQYNDLERHCFEEIDHMNFESLHKFRRGDTTAVLYRFLS